MKLSSSKELEFLYSFKLYICNNYKYVEILNKANIMTRIATLMNV